jgi:hypothetical protein
MMILGLDGARAGICSCSCLTYRRSLSPFRVQKPANNMCHRKPLLWDPNDRVHTSHRLLCACLVLSALVRFWCPGAPPTARLLPSPSADALLVSPFYGGRGGVPLRLAMDLLYQTLFVYPALAEIDRIIPKLRSGSVFTVTGNRTWDYGLAVLVLVVGIGGGANLLAATVTKRGPVRGYSSVVAASLGYYQRIRAARSAVLVTVYGHEMTAAGAYWTGLAWIVAGQDGGDWVPPLVSWLVSGLAGSVMANYHLDNVVVVVLSDFFRFFGLG